MKLDRPAMPGVVPPAPALRAADAVRRGIGRLHDGTAPPAVRIIEQFAGVAELAATAAIVEAGIPDLLADGPRTAEELADAAGVDPGALRRMLVFLAGRGVVARTRQGDRFALTGVSDLLRRDHPDSLRDWARFAGAPWTLEAWAETGEALAGRVPFEVAHGQDFFELVTHDDEAGELFDGAMRAGSRLTSQLLLTACDFDRFSSVCDVGGGTGTLLARILKGHPALIGTVADLAPTIARAERVLQQEGVAGRARVEVADFFEEVPTGHDLYLLVSVLHDWSDDDAVRILRTVRAAMSDRAELWVVDLVRPRHHGDSLVSAVDLLMLVLATGRERTEDQLGALFTRAGLHRRGATPLLNGAVVQHLTTGPAPGSAPV